MGEKKGNFKKKTKTKKQTNKKWFESVPLSFPLHCREHPPRTVLNGLESPREAFIPQPRRAGRNRYGNRPRPHPLVGFAQAPTEMGLRKRKSRLGVALSEEGRSNAEETVVT